MSSIRLVATEGEPNPEDKKILAEGLLSHHASKGHPRKPQLFSIFLKDQNDKVLGGIIVSFLWNSMHIQSLWVDDSTRKQGWGRKLMQAAEAEAIKRGCTIAYTSTFSWQAPGLYKKLGYNQFGILDNFPEGCSLSYFYKRLTK